MSSFDFSGAASIGMPAFHGGIGALPGALTDSIGCQTLSTLSVNRSPIRMRLHELVERQF